MEKSKIQILQDTVSRSYATADEKRLILGMLDALATELTDGVESLSSNAEDLATAAAKAVELVQSQADISATGAQAKLVNAGKKIRALKAELEGIKSAFQSEPESEVKA